MKSNYRHIIIISITCLFFCFSTQAQESRDELKLIEEAVEQMFEGMKTGDSAGVHAVMSDEVIFQSTALKDGKPTLFTGSLDRFLQAIGTPHEQVWDERISDLKIEIDGPLATAWMNYSFYVGDEFSHCGVNAMTFFKSSEGWKIIYLIDTRRKENCNG